MLFVCCSIQVIQELKDLVEQKERFMSSMSHELRTPLNGIIGLSDALLVGSCGEVNDQVRTGEGWTGGLPSGRDPPRVGRGSGVPVLTQNLVWRKGCRMQLSKVQDWSPQKGVGWANAERVELTVPSLSAHRPSRPLPPSKQAAPACSTSLTTSWTRPPCARWARWMFGGVHPAASYLDVNLRHTRTHAHS